jgi:hypothetical protein
VLFPERKDTALPLGSFTNHIAEAYHAFPYRYEPFGSSKFVENLHFFGETRECNMYLTLCKLVLTSIINKKNRNKICPVLSPPQGVPSDYLGGVLGGTPGKLCWKSTPHRARNLLCGHSSPPQAVPSGYLGGVFWPLPIKYYPKVKVKTWTPGVSIINRSVCTPAPSGLLMM